MKKLLQLIFGDWRNTASIAGCVALAAGIERMLPAAGGWVLVPALLLAAWWQAAA